MGMYAAPTQAIQGCTDALRIEVMMDGRPVSITLIKPGLIATPVLEHQRNLLDRRATTPPRFYPPEDVARSILYAAEHWVRELFVGGGGASGITLGQMLPSVADVAAAWTARRLFKTADLATERPDNLYEPGMQDRVPGERRVFTVSLLRPGATGAAQR